MARRYLWSPLPPAGRHEAPPDLAHHVGRVLRARAGAAIALFDGAGREADAVVVRAGRTVEFDVGPAREADRRARVDVELACALPKAQRAEWLFEHATEVGVTAFRPLLTARAVRPAADRVERWRRVVAAAAGQCDRSHLPRVHPPCTLAELVAAELPAERFVAVLGAPPLARAGAGRALLVVGPEGGLDDSELALLAGAGFHARGLGPLTLRTETAALVGAATLLAP